MGISSNMATLMCSADAWKVAALWACAEQLLPPPPQPRPSGRSLQQGPDLLGGGVVIEVPGCVPGKGAEGQRGASGHSRGCLGLLELLSLPPHRWMWWRSCQTIGRSEHGPWRVSGALLLTH